MIHCRVAVVAVLLLAAAGTTTPGALVIDPEEAVRAAFAGWLLRQGYVVWTVANQDEALAVYRQHGSAIALIVEDLHFYWLPPRDTSPKR